MSFRSVKKGLIPKVEELLFVLDPSEERSLGIGGLSEGKVSRDWLSIVCGFTVI